MIRICRRSTLENLKKRLSDKESEVEDLTARLATAVGESEEQKNRVSMIAHWVCCMIFLHKRSFVNLPKRQLERTRNLDLAVRRDSDGTIHLETQNRLEAQTPAIREAGAKEVVGAS